MQSTIKLLLISFQKVFQVTLAFTDFLFYDISMDESDKRDKSSNSEQSTGKSVLKKKKYSFRCDRDNCEKEYQSQSRLDDHIKVFHDGQSIQCNECKKHFNTRTSLRDHFKTYHDDENPIRCDECGTRFASKSKLYIHISSVHEKVFPYPCQKCAKGCMSASLLESHMKAVHPLPPNPGNSKKATHLLYENIGEPGRQPTAQARLREGDSEDAGPKKH